MGFLRACQNVGFIEQKASVGAMMAYSVWRQTQESGCTQLSFQRIQTSHNITYLSGAPGHCLRDGKETSEQETAIYVVIMN